MGTKKRKSYSKEYKLNAVRMTMEAGNKATEVARDLGIPVSMLYNWKSTYKSDESESFPGHGRMKPQDDYIRRLEQENKRLKEERDILKKAAIFFAKDP